MKIGNCTCSQLSCKYCNQFHGEQIRDHEYDLKKELETLRAKLAEGERERDEWESHARQMNKLYKEVSNRSKKAEADFNREMKARDKAETELGLCYEVFAEERDAIWERCAEIAELRAIGWRANGSLLGGTYAKESDAIASAIRAERETWRK